MSFKPNFLLIRLNRLVLSLTLNLRNILFDNFWDESMPLVSF